jgi:sugar-specific transcriptional regulator TrmB
MDRMAGPMSGTVDSNQLDGQEVIEQLQEVMDWGEYEAAAYATLVREGPLEANDIVYRTDIPQGRVYDTLNGLSESAVTAQGQNPTRYDAQHPRKLIKRKQDEFNDSASQIKDQLEQVYDVEQDRHETRHPAWVTAGLPGTVQRMEELIEDADESVFIVDSDLRWIQNETTATLTGLIEQDVAVQVVGWRGRLEKLEELASAGVPVYSHESVESSFCIVDDEHAVIRVGRGETGVAIQDAPMARILTREADRKEENASRVTADE